MPMFFQFNAKTVDAINEALNKKAQAFRPDQSGTIFMQDVDGAIVLDNPKFVKVVSERSGEPTADEVEKTMLYAERYGWVPLSMHVDYADYNLKPLNTERVDDFLEPFKVFPGHVENVEVKMK